MRIASPVVLLMAAGLSFTQAGCKRDPDPPASAPKAAPAEAPAASPEPAEAPEEPDDEAPAERPPATTIRISTADRTSDAEKPADISKDLDSLASAAATKAGFTVQKGGNRAEVEVYYAFTVDGVPDPKAERGLLVYAVSARVRVVDDQGVGELLEGRAGSEAPFVRAALPDLRVAFRTLLEEATESAFRDVAMQIRYRELPLDQARAGLGSGLPEERWASARRLGELEDKGAVPSLVALLEEAGPLEIGVIAGVLGQLRDARAVAALVARVEAVPTEVGVLIVDALASIGGAEATSALEDIAAKHPLDAVKEAAKEHLTPADP